MGISFGLYLLNAKNGCFSSIKIYCNIHKIKKAGIPINAPAIVKSSNKKHIWATLKNLTNGVFLVGRFVGIPLNSNFARMVKINIINKNEQKQNQKKSACSV